MHAKAKQDNNTKTKRTQKSLICVKFVTYTKEKNFKFYKSKNL